MACGPSDDPPSAESRILSTAADTPRPKPELDQSPLLLAEEIDQRILEREKRTLVSLQRHPYHQNKTREQQVALAQVGKSDFQQFWTTVKKAAPMDPLTRDEVQARSIFAEYKRIWYLADDAYKANRSKKFQPDLALKPYLRTKVPHQFVPHLLTIMRVELERESKDPRALGSECSEMLKLQTIVDTLTMRDEDRIMPPILMKASFFV